MRATVTLLLVVALLAACGSDKPGPPKTYSDNGFRFEYPSNYETSIGREGGRVVTTLYVEGSESALLVLQRFRPAVDTTLSNYVGEWRAIRESGLDEVTLGKAMTIAAGRVSPVTCKVAGRERQGLQETFDLSLLGETVPHRVEYYRLVRKGVTLFIVAQAAEEDWEHAKAAFKMVFDSLELEWR